MWRAWSALHQICSRRPEALQFMCAHTVDYPAIFNRFPIKGLLRLVSKQLSSNYRSALSCVVGVAFGRRSLFGNKSGSVCVCVYGYPAGRRLGRRRKCTIKYNLVWTMRVRVSGRSHASPLHNETDLYLFRKADCRVSTGDLHEAIFTVQSFEIPPRGPQSDIKSFWHLFTGNVAVSTVLSIGQWLFLCFPA